MESLENSHKRIKEAIENRQVEIGVNWVLLNRVGSPVYNGFDHGVPGLILTGLVAYNFYAGGWTSGLVSLVGSTVFFFWIIRKWGFARLDRRTRRLALSSAEAWELLWNLGGLSLRLNGHVEVFCHSPKDSWQDFVRAYVP